MNKQGRPPLALPRVVKRLGVVSFFNDFASEMVYPLLPALVTTRLGGSAVTLGLLDGLSEAVSAIIKATSGWLAERARWRRPLIVIGYGIATVARPAMGIVSGAWQVIGLRAADRVGKGVRTPPRDTIIADVSAPGIRGRAFGFHRGMDHAGAVVGPLVAWAALVWGGADPAAVIRWSLIPGVLAVMAVVWALGRIDLPMVRRDRVSDQGTAPDEAQSGGRVLFGLVVGFAFIRFPETLFLLRIQDLGVAVAAVPLLWAFLHVVRSLGSYPGGWASDVLGPKRTMVVGWLLYATVCVGLALSHTALGASAWFLAFGLVAAATESPERTFVAAAGGATGRGRRFGAYHAAVGLAALPGSLFLGALYAGRGGAWALAVSGGTAAVLALIGTVTRHAPRAPTRT
ncbi:MAG: MFS transporter [Gemmatimonadota bacterium]|nr:MFS transporter [Gemmatimonadota bacterium]MDH3368215.1 MFS transporter [Gemmatimonadota bacterium]MDH3478052.1 MFS transporter [Gemmatimonadota bacterium]MDH3570091.1 MFS transporter [Gemmatimonadota bacterium]MDH5551005.1 MFS transporter [Gemmatimonadota bacterium]